MPAKKNDSNTKKTHKKTTSKKSSSSRAKKKPQIQLSRKIIGIVAVIVFAVVGSFILLTSQAAEVSLVYPRPDTAGYKTLQVPDSGRVTNLDPNTDYKLIMPDKPIPSLDLAGGRNIVIIGGEISVNTPPSIPSDPPLGRKNRAMNIQKWTGHLYIEGVEFSGKWMFEGINANSRASEFPNAKLTMQKIRFSDPVYAVGRGTTTGNHDGGDVYQSWFQPAQGTYLADWTITGATYQGFFIQDIGNGKTTNIEMKRIEMRHLNTWPTQAIKDSGLNPDQFYNPGTFKYAFSGVNSLLLEDVYLTQNTTGDSQNWESQLSLRSDGLPRNTIGTVKKGSPSSDFVPAGTVGLNYDPVDPTPTPDPVDPEPETPAAAPEANFTVSEPRPEAGQEVTFDGSSSKNAVKWVWDDAVGTVGQYPLGEGEVIKFTFQRPGTKQVRLTVTSEDGQKDVRIIPIEVQSETTTPEPTPDPAPEPVDPTPEPITDKQAPTRPSNLSRSLFFDWTRFGYSMGLNWNASTDNVGVKEYQIFRNGSRIGTTTSTSFKDTNISANILYNYNVRAVDAAGNVSPQATTSAQGSCFLFWCTLQ